MQSWYRLQQWSRREVLDGQRPSSAGHRSFCSWWWRWIPSWQVLCWKLKQAFLNIWRCIWSCDFLAERVYRLVDLNSWFEIVSQIVGRKPNSEIRSLDQSMKLNSLPDKWSQSMKGLSILFLRRLHRTFVLVNNEFFAPWCNYWCSILVQKGSQRSSFFTKKGHANRFECRVWVMLASFRFYFVDDSSFLSLSTLVAFNTREKGWGMRRLEALGIASYY